jgi:hypothetical protein
MAERDKKPKYEINIEDKLYPWTSDTITVPEIRELGSLPANLPVIEVDQHNNERTLAEDEVVKLKPGHSFGKKVHFKRG